MMSSEPSDAVILVEDPTSGEGWDGPNADNDKVAFMAGALVADPPLSAEQPPAGVVTLGDGSTRTVELISAAEALDRMTAEETGTKCDSDCTPVVVTGAKLTTAQMDTTEGSVTLPVWQFEFKPADAPMQPITYVSLKDVVWLQSENGDARPEFDEAFGNAKSTSIGVVFSGAPYAGDNPCGADYSATAVESDLAVAIVITGSHRVSQGDTACLLFARGRTAIAQLSQPLGNRVVLDAGTGDPAKLVDASPPPDSPLPNQTAPTN